ncbi:vesicular, overexpressed in cancer, prosurvival protein 1-like [Sinocyclocheilus grahami]|uniref:vesicular, overexpressed in cancer, prosurvival protein 1-like n=1 Tax=Sinocyclocheilus grahami TaxID=75366 RepID=UPI0007AD3CC0|nr:PREDICTED: vesicular, overexpressed in cancer, prosurvival protein 1-like [Sinocyclocheilus grahami]
MQDCCGTQCCSSPFCSENMVFLAAVYKWHFVLLQYWALHSQTCPPERPDFNVAFTRQPIISPGLRPAGFHNYGDSETAVISTVYQVQTHPSHVTAVYSALPSHYRQPPPSYDQVMQDLQKK